MLLIKIDRSSIRKNPNYGKSLATLTETRVMEFEARGSAVRENTSDGRCEIVYPEWILNVNYLIQSEDRIDNSYTKVGRRLAPLDIVVRGVCIGGELPRQVMAGKRWPDITTEVRISGEENAPVDHREFLFRYEDLPEWISCEKCCTTYRGIMLQQSIAFRDGACPFCSHGLVEFEEFKWDQ